MKGGAVDEPHNKTMAKEINLPEGLDPDTAKDVLREYAQVDSPKIIESDRLDTLESELDEFKQVFAELLSEESPQSADTLAEQSAEALTEPYRDDGGDIEVDTLRQEPESQTGNVSSGGSDSDGFDPESVTRSEYSDLDTLKKKVSVMENRGMENRAEEIRSEMVDLVDAPDYDTLEKEVF